MKKTLLMINNCSKYSRNGIVYNVTAIRYMSRLMCVNYEIAKDELINRVSSNDYYALNFIIRSDDKIIINNGISTSDFITKTAYKVRGYMVDSYGTEDSLIGHSDEAADIIIKILSLHGIQSRKINGWCKWDKTNWRNKIECDKRSWVELTNGTFIDVTADQFNYGMNDDRQYKSVIVQNSLPYGIIIENPKISEFAG